MKLREAMLILMWIMQKDQSHTCAGSCPSCPMSGHDGDASDEGLNGWIAAHEIAASDNTLRGLPLAVRSTLAFFVPVAAALLGAVLTGGSEVKRFCGLIIGLVVGVVIAKLGSFFVTRLFTRNTRDTRGARNTRNNLNVGEH